jgi:2-methylisocitrate lyase-like PEP mutase family enzyme
MPEPQLPSSDLQSRGCDLLRERFATRDTLFMPDAFDPLSARLIEHLGFPAVQCSGFSFALSAASPCEAEFGFERNLALTTQIARAVAIPVMADGEDGFGGPEVVANTVRAFVAAGVVGINIEDQVLGDPKVRAVVDVEPAREKIAAAVAAARDRGLPRFIVNARTDALAVADDKHAGLAQAIERANGFLEEGAALAFVTGVTTLEQVHTLIANIAGPVSIAAGLNYNLGAFSIADLRAAGVARVTLPSVAVLAALEGMRRTLEAIDSSLAFDEAVQRALLAGNDLAAALRPTGRR